MIWLWILAAVVVAGSLVAIKITPHGRWICAACTDKFETEPALTAHIERAHGYCTSSYGMHPCRLPADGHTRHCCSSYPTEDSAQRDAYKHERTHR